MLAVFDEKQIITNLQLVFFLNQLVLWILYMK